MQPRPMQLIVMNSFQRSGTGSAMPTFWKAGTKPSRHTLPRGDNARQKNARSGTHGFRAKFIDLSSKRISCWFQATGPPVHYSSDRPGNRSRGAMRVMQRSWKAVSPNGMFMVLFLSMGNGFRRAMYLPPALTPPVWASPITAATRASVVLPPSLRGRAP